MIELYEFQQKASATMAERFSRYIADPVITGTRQHQRTRPVLPGTRFDHGVRQDGHPRRRGVVHHRGASRAAHRAVALEGAGCRRADACQPPARRQVPPPPRDCGGAPAGGVRPGRSRRSPETHRLFRNGGHLQPEGQGEWHARHIPLRHRHGGPVHLGCAQAAAHPGQPPPAR